MAKGKSIKNIGLTQTGAAEHWPSTAADELRRDNLARELLGICLQSLKTYGLDEGRLMELARAAVKQKFLSIPSSALVLSDPRSEPS